MRVLVYPHLLTMGGSQLNAVELAAAVRDRGHDVLVFGQPGPLVDLVHDLALPYVPAPPAHRRPSSAVVRALSAVVAERDIDVLHGYEWPPALECFLAGTVRHRRPSVCTVMSMGVAPFIPERLPLVVGTEQIRAHSAAGRRGPVTLLEPPVDTTANAPGVDTDAFRQRFGLRPDDLHVVVVSRLAQELKLEGLLDAVATVGRLAADLPVRLVVVGDGPARAAVAAAAAEVDEALGRSVVVLTGELSDPRPAYALADVALGMGGSALRAMAFARPLVVQGERGFWQEASPGTVELFLHQGWYGIGDGTGQRRLEVLLRRLLHDPARRAELGQFSRELVCGRFSLERAARLQEQVYEEAAAVPLPPAALAVDGVRSASGLARHDLGRRWRRLRGRAVSSEDFNALAAQAGPGRPPAQPADRTPSRASAQGRGTP